MEKKKIDTLQALRFIAILFVFIEHTGVTGITGMGGTAVSFFFVLSGFVLVLGSDSTQQDYSLKAHIQFLEKKISKFYPLHFLTQLADAFLLFLLFAKHHDNVIANSILIFKKLALNLLLIQSFVPVKGYYMNEINGVSWFLSTAMFLYFISLSVLKYANRLQKKKAPKYLCLLGLLLIIYILSGMFECTSVSEYLLYVCPFVRSLDFLIGATTALIYKDWATGKLPGPVFFTVLETLIPILFVLNHVFLRHGLNPVCSILLILVFSFERGYLSKLLRNKIFVYLGNMSFSIYMVHKVVIRYVSTLFGWSYTSAGISAVATLCLCVLLAALPQTKLLKSQLQNSSRK